MSLLNQTLTNLISFDFINFQIVGYILLCFFAYILYSYIIYPYHFGPLSRLPRPKNSLLHLFKFNYNRSIGDYKHLLKLSQEYGPVVHLFGNFVLLNDPSTRKYWLTYKFPKSSFYSVFEINGPNLFSTTDKEFHIKMKKLILPAFSTKALANIESTVYRVGSENLVNMISSSILNNNEQIFDLFHLFHCSTFDIISKLVFGISFNTIFDQELGHYYIKRLGKAQVMLFWRTLIPFYRKVAIPITSSITSMILENIQSRRNESDRGKSNQDILQSMIDSEDPETGAKLTDIEIVDQCLTLLFAGMDTTANTLTWTLYELLRNPETYKLVENEILINFPNLNEPISLDKSKSELKYLEAAILESMRMHPVAAGGLPRVVPKEGITVAGHFLPEKTVILLPIYSQHHDPDFWHNPEMFDIHRWLGDDREQLKAQLMVFGLGPRSCIGRELAWNEMYLVLANLIRNFEMELVDKELTPTFKFLYKPKEKRMNVKVSLRNMV